MSFFKEYTKRFFFLLGKTDDEFITERLEILTSEEVLFYHLKELGYERIVFYNGRQKIYFMDLDSKVASQRKTETEPTPTKRGSRLGNLKPVIRKSILTTAKKREIEFTPTTEQLHLGSMEDVEVVGLLDYIMRDKGKKTAVVFSRGIDFIGHLDPRAVRMMALNMMDWNILDSSNENICAFIFPELNMEELRRSIQASSWNFFLPLLFENELKLTPQAITIGSPTEAEITSLLHYYRIKHEVVMDWKNMQSMVQTMTRYARSEGLKLKDLHARLRQRRMTQINLSLCQDLFGKTEDEPAFKRLQQMKGMEVVCEKVERLLLAHKELDKLERPQEPTPQAQTFIPERFLPGQKDPDSSQKNLHFALKGNPGTGKTTVAKMIGEIYRDEGLLPSGHTVVVTRKDLVGGYVGQTALRTAEKIADAIGGVLFVDEAYQLSEGGDNDFGKEAIETIMEAMSSRKGEFAVVIAGYPEKIDHFIEINPGLTRRFGQSNMITIPDYTPDILQAIFEEKLEKENQSLSKEFEEMLPHFIHNWYNGRDPQNFGNAGDVENLLSEMKEIRSYRAFGSKEFTPEDLPEPLEKYWKKRKSATVDEALGLVDDLTGLKNVKQWLKALTNRMQMQKRRQARGLKTEPIIPGHYLFIGNPGTGKTTVAKRFGEILNLLGLIGRSEPVIMTPDDLVSSYRGEPEKKMKEYIEKSKNGILFIDEAHELRHKAEGAFKALTQPLTEYADSLCVILAGYPEPMEELLRLDPGMKRRFQEPVVFEDFSDDELYDIFESTVLSNHEKMTDEVSEDLRRLFSLWNAEKKQDFGNAGDVLKLLEQMRACRDDRLASNWDETMLDEELTLFTSDDIPTHEREKIGHRPNTLKDVLDNLHDLTGLQNVKRQIGTMVNRIEMERIRGREQNFAPGHYIFAGNPGTGKTTVAARMGEIFQTLGLLKTSRVVEAKRADLVAGYMGQTAEKTRAKLMEALDGVLFIDEAYQLNNGAQDSFGKESINVMIDFMENYRHRISIIAAGYTDKMNEFLTSNPGLSSRFQVIYFDDYSNDELFNIFLGMVKKEHYLLGDGVEEGVKEIIYTAAANRDSHFGNARSIRNFFDRVLANLNNRLAHLIALNGEKQIEEETLYRIVLDDLPPTI